MSSRIGVLRIFPGITAEAVSTLNYLNNSFFYVFNLCVTMNFKFRQVKLGRMFGVHP